MSTTTWATTSNHHAATRRSVALPADGVTRQRRFVVVSGLPGSGKTTVARALAPLMNLPVIDKDEILERLFEARGIGDAAWRRQLSREADAVMHDEVSASGGAIVSSFWHVPGMA